MASLPNKEWSVKAYYKRIINFAEFKILKEMQTLQKPISKRIEYIDAMRGFTMILVVFSHVELFTFQNQISFINQLFVSFRMPLFFFVSGFIGYRANVDWTIGKWWDLSKKKLIVQIIPTLVFGLIYAYLYKNSNCSIFLTSSMKLGYWFTIALCEMFLVLYTMNLIVYNCNFRNPRRGILVSLVAISAVFYFVMLLPKFVPSAKVVFDLLSFNQTAKFFPFFAFGYICSMYKDTFNKLIENKYVITAVLVTFAVWFYVWVSLIAPKAESDITMFLADTLSLLVVGALGAVIVYNTFKTYSSTFSSDKMAGRVLQGIGKRTLDIYLLHFFFLPSIPQIGEFVSSGNNTTVELFLGIALSLVIVALCLTVSSIIRTSPVLAKYLVMMPFLVGITIFLKSAKSSYFALFFCSSFRK